MITNYLFLNRELLDDVYGTLGSILVVTRNRTDAVNFYNELLMKYSGQHGVLRNDSEMSVASKASKITVRAVRNKEDLDGFRGNIFTKIYAVGFYSDEELDFLSMCVKEIQK